MSNKMWYDEKPEDMYASVESDDDMSLEEFDAELERIEKRDNSILYRALEAAKNNVFKLYRARIDAAGIDLDDPASRAAHKAEHIALVRERDAANKQIEDWMKTL